MYAVTMCRQHNIGVQVIRKQVIGNKFVFVVVSFVTTLIRKSKHYEPRYNTRNNTMEIVNLKTILIMIFNFALK